MSKIEIKNPMRQLTLSSKMADAVTTTTNCWVEDDPNLSAGDTIFLEGDERRWKVDFRASHVVARASLPKGDRIGVLRS